MKVGDKMNFKMPCEFCGEDAEFILIYLDTQEVIYVCVECLSEVQERVTRS